MNKPKQLFFTLWTSQLQWSISTRTPPNPYFSGQRPIIKDSGKINSINWFHNWTYTNVSSIRLHKNIISTFLVKVHKMLIKRNNFLRMSAPSNCIIFAMVFLGKKYKKNTKWYLRQVTKSYIFTPIKPNYKVTFTDGCKVAI